MVEILVVELGGVKRLVLVVSGRVCSLRKKNFQNCQKILKTTPIMYKNKVGNTYYPYFWASVKYLSFTVNLRKNTYNAYFLNILNCLTIHVLLYLGKAREHVFCFYPQHTTKLSTTPTTTLQLLSCYQPIQPYYCINKIYTIPYYTKASYKAQNKLLQLVNSINRTNISLTQQNTLTS